MSSENQTLYIKGSRDVEVTKPDVTLGDILTMECSDKKLIPKIKTIQILKFRGGKQQRCAVSVLKIIECIHEQFPRMEVQNLGETDIIVTYENQKTPAFIWHMVKTVFVAAVTFFGAAFSIMAFNNDVDVTRMFGQIHELITGQQSDGFTILEITYSVGLTAGILIFFNHFGKRRFTADPTPMEIQMRLYENDIQTTLVETAERKGGRARCGRNRSFWQSSDLAPAWRLRAVFFLLSWSWALWRTLRIGPIPVIRSSFMRTAQLSEEFSAISGMCLTSVFLREYGGLPCSGFLQVYLSDAGQWRSPRY